MTEICEIAKVANRYTIDPVAFFIALFGAPILFALPGAAILLTGWPTGSTPFAPFGAVAIISLFAVLFGGAPYLIIGGPLLVYTLHRQEPNSGKFALLGFAANFLTPFLVAPFIVMAGSFRSIGFVFFVFAFGVIFAPLWSSVFAVLYRKFRRKPYSHPL